MKIHRDVIGRDLKKCLKKWYIGLDKEFPRVLKLLIAERSLPGQSPLRGFQNELSGKIFHARINLPQEAVGKRKGARIVYYLSFDSDVLILYLGGHKDPIYNTSELVAVVKMRFRDNGDGYMAYQEYIDSL